MPPAGPHLGAAPGVAGADVQLQAAARLLSHLLLYEIDSNLIAELEQSGANEVLKEMGIPLPALTDKEAVDNLSVEYFERFVNPAVGAPPIQSLAEEGKYAGKASESMEKIAIAAGLTFASDRTRGAPMDHLGSQLAMWSELNERDPAAAKDFCRRHLVWATRTLEIGSPQGFYGQLSRTVCEFIKAINH